MSLFKFSNEKRPRIIVAWFWLGFRFAFRWAFRVSSSRERAVTAQFCKNPILRHESTVQWTFEKPLKNDSGKHLHGHCRHLIEWRAAFWEFLCEIHCAASGTAAPSKKFSNVSCTVTFDAEFSGELPFENFYAVDVAERVAQQSLKNYSQMSDV